MQNGPPLWEIQLSVIFISGLKTAVISAFA